MELQFKKFKITNDKRQFILIYEGNPSRKYYYSSIKDLLLNIPKKMMLKSESQKIDELIMELNSIYKFIEEMVRDTKI